MDQKLPFRKGKPDEGKEEDGFILVKLGVLGNTEWWFLEFSLTFGSWQPVHG